MQWKGIGFLARRGGFSANSGKKRVFAWRSKGGKGRRLSDWRRRTHHGREDFFFPLEKKGYRKGEGKRTGGGLA